MRVVLAFGFLAPLAAANVFLMCAQSAYIDGLGLANVYSGTVNTQSLCEQACAQSSAYSIYGPGKCHCTNDAPPYIPYSVESAIGGGGCSSTVIPSYTTTVLANSRWVLGGCWTGGYWRLVTVGEDDFSSPAVCLDQCLGAGGKHAQLAPWTADGGVQQYTCYCAMDGGANAIDGSDALNKQGCKSASTVFYYLDAIPIRPSNNPKRKRARNSESLCPGRTTACTIPGTGVYECVDTAAELESCGGCTAGVFNSTVAATGVELVPANDSVNHANNISCTQIPGVTLGGVQCRAGRCVVSACEKGWAVTADACAAV